MRLMEYDFSLHLYPKGTLKMKRNTELHNMLNRLFCLLLLTINILEVNGQGITQQIDNYLKSNKIPHYDYKNSLRQGNKSGYFFTNRKGQTTLSLPKGVIDMSVPVGDSVVYGKIKSPTFTGDAKGELILAEYVDGVKVKENFIGIGKINASVGVRVDWTIDNKEHTSLNLYFLSGQIISYPLKRNPDKLIQAFFMNENLKSVKMGNEVKSCLLYEDTKEGKFGQMLVQWAKKMNEQEFMKKVAVELKSYYMISYKMKRL